MSQSKMYDDNHTIPSLAKSLMASEDYINSSLFSHFTDIFASYIPVYDTQQNKISILSREIEHILDTIPLGIVIVDSEGLIQPDYSRFMAQLYPHGKNFSSKPVENVLYGKTHTEKDKNTFKNWLKLVFDINYDWDLIKDLGPDVIRHDSNGAPLYYQNFFHRIVHENRKIYLIIHIMDISETTRQKMAIEEQAAAQQFEVDLLSSIVDHEYSKEIIDFINDTERLIREARIVFKGLDQAEDKPSAFNHLFRLVHSIKGLSGVYGIKDFVRLTNRAEDILSLFRDNHASIESEQIDGVPASKKLRDTLEEISGLFDRAKGIVQKIFNPEREESASIRLRRRDVKIDSERLKHVIRAVQNLKSQSEQNPEDLSNTVDHVLSEIMSLTLHPVDVVYNRFKKIVNDVSLSLEKQVDLILEGDRILLDPDSHHLLITALIHILRNALDHGIETPETRLKAGKKACGTIQITTKKSSDTATITISDDGQGIDPDGIAQKALENGLITQKQPETMSDREKIDLIFLPGFSIKTEITDLSGRGVGMDTVRDNIKKLKGSVTIETQKNKGTTLTLSFPINGTQRAGFDPPQPA